MSDKSAWVQLTDHGDGSAEFTVTVGDEDHKYSALAQDGSAVVQYEETQSWRGEIRVSEPDKEMFRALATSEPMTAFLEEHDLNGVRHHRNP